MAGCTETLDARVARLRRSGRPTLGGGSEVTSRCRENGARIGADDEEVGCLRIIENLVERRRQPNLRRAVRRPVYLRRQRLGAPEQFLAPERIRRLVAFA